MNSIESKVRKIKLTLVLPADFREVPVWEICKDNKVTLIQLNR